MYLSSRSIGQAAGTRDFLLSITQDGGFKMPDGPVIISPDGLIPSLYREMVLRRPHEFKIRCLEDVRRLFPAGWNPFHSGFGNRCREKGQKEREETKRERREREVDQGSHAPPALSLTHTHHSRPSSIFTGTRTSCLT